MEESVALDFLFDQRIIPIDEVGDLMQPKVEVPEIQERGLRHMYRLRVLAGDLPLVLFDPIFWGRLLDLKVRAHQLAMVVGAMALRVVPLLC